jgi:hypothetical protein
MTRCIHTRVYIGILLLHRRCHAHILSAYGRMINEDCLGRSGRGLVEAQTLHDLRNFRLRNLRQAFLNK